MGEYATLIYASIGLGSLIGLVAIVGGFLHHRRERMLTHAERMKALEMGRDWPEDAATARLEAAFSPLTGSGEGGSPGSRCFSTALWVAFWGFLAASQASAIHPGVSYAIASSVGAIGVTALICGTILLTWTSPEASDVARRKPRVEKDELDVVGSRG